MHQKILGWAAGRKESEGQEAGGHAGQAGLLCKAFLASLPSEFLLHVIGQKQVTRAS